MNGFINENYSCKPISYHMIQLQNKCLPLIQVIISQFFEHKFRLILNLIKCPIFSLSYFKK